MSHYVEIQLAGGEGLEVGGLYPRRFSNVRSILCNRSVQNHTSLPLVRQSAFLWRRVHLGPPMKEFVARPSRGSWYVDLSAKRYELPPEGRTTNSASFL